ncbi:MAG: hypothetical protein ACE5OR_17395, partial [bacterium]
GEHRHHGYFHAHLFENVFLNTPAEYSEKDEHHVHCGKADEHCTPRKQTTRIRNGKNQIPKTLKFKSDTNYATLTIFLIAYHTQVLAFSAPTIPSLHLKKFTNRTTGLSPPYPIS